MTWRLMKELMYALESVKEANKMYKALVLYQKYLNNREKYEKKFDKMLNRIDPTSLDDVLEYATKNADGWVILLSRKSKKEAKNEIEFYLNMGKVYLGLLNEYAKRHKNDTLSEYVQSVIEKYEKRIDEIEEKFKEKLIGLADKYSKGDVPTLPLDPPNDVHILPVDPQNHV